jgi:hypothetical protein
VCSTEPSTSKDDFSCKPARFVGREESPDQSNVFWHAGATERRDGPDGEVEIYMESAEFPY